MTTDMITILAAYAAGLGTGVTLTVAAGAALGSRRVRSALEAQREVFRRLLGRGG